MHRLAGIRLATTPAYRAFATAASSSAGSAGKPGSSGSSGSSGSAARPSRLGGKPALSLEHFLQRGRALALYRTIVRGTRQISDATTRAETLRFARDEFERHRGVTDLTHIRYLISTGKTEWENTERYIGGM
ncbi:hypothetical protein SCUCBS95973_004419 [Sporothrix curviconia]|uniref:LYR motif-containing protein 2 n=1 Tax=Sporothrix curviconia TaxID=1260050 RepID=A0ABP0BNE6_9PEZI